MIKNALESRVTDLGAPGKDNIYGSGKLALGVAPDFAAPVISSVTPAGNVYASSAVIAVYYADVGSGINTSAVNITLDGAGLAGCTITASYAACPAANLTAGAHSIGGSVADNTGNSSPISGSFTVICASPQLGLGIPQPSWGSYTDYLARQLSVSYSVSDSAGTGAYSIQVEGSTNTGSVIATSALPIALGDIPGGTTVYLTLTMKYEVPSGVTSFRSITYMTAKDACGNLYTFPGVYPGA